MIYLALHLLETFLLVNVDSWLLWDILWISSPPISTFSGFYTLQISVGTLALAAEALVGFLPWRRGGSVLGTVKKRQKPDLCGEPEISRLHMEVYYI